MSPLKKSLGTAKGAQAFAGLCGVFRRSEKNLQGSAAEGAASRETERGDTVCMTGFTGGRADSARR